MKDGARKTQIMYKGNLSYKLLTHYLREVVGAGLVCVEEKANLYQLTEKGEMFLRHFESYSKSRVKVEQHLNSVRSLREILENMCMFKHASENPNSKDILNSLRKSNRNGI